MNLTSWGHYIVTINLDLIEEKPIVYVNKRLVPVVEQTSNRTGNIGTIGYIGLAVGFWDGASSSELQGSLQHFAFINKSLAQSEVDELYRSSNLVNTSLNNGSNIIDYWQLGNEENIYPLNIGDPISIETTISPTIGSTVLAVPSDITVSEGKGKVGEKHNNFYIQSVLPQSDYNYSWVDSTLRDNYSVRSGTQKVFGYWPKNGINKINGVFDSAITFPSASTIQGS